MRDIVEKPAPGAEPSHLVSLGRYLFAPDLFPLLAEVSQSIAEANTTTFTRCGSSRAAVRSAR